MPTPDRITVAVDRALTEELDARTEELAEISADLGAVIPTARSLLEGGKRYRAAFCYWGWHGVRAARDGADHLTATAKDPGYAALLDAAVAIELLHVAALVHDDLIDSSDTRRGVPSAHRSLAAWHRRAEWDGDSDRFGERVALLLGDVLLSWSDERMARALDGLDLDVRAATRAAAQTMRREVMYGQILDVIEESAWRRSAPTELLARASRVAVYKSARYTVEAPLLVGASMAGASADQLESLSGYGIPVGTAFQMRDDILGVFGDPETTGKPAGDDLREGKRTVLVELARRRLAPGVRTMLDELLGDPTLDDVQIAMLQDAIKGSGALDELEQMISRAVGAGLESLRDAALSRGAELELERLAVKATQRDR